MHVIHDRKSSSAGEGGGGRDCVDREEGKEGEAEGGGGGGEIESPKTRDEETMSVKRQSDGEPNSSGETDRTRAARLH